MRCPCCGEYSLAPDLCRYEFDYEDPDDDMGGCLYIVGMRPHQPES